MTKRDPDELTTIIESVGYHGGNVKYTAEELSSEARRQEYARKLIASYAAKGSI